MQKIMQMQVKYLDSVHKKHQNGGKSDLCDFDRGMVGELSSWRLWIRAQEVSPGIWTQPSSQNLDLLIVITEHETLLIHILFPY